MAAVTGSSRDTDLAGSPVPYEHRSSDENTLFGLEGS